MRLVGALLLTLTAAAGTAHGALLGQLCTPGAVDPVNGCLGGMQCLPKQIGQAPVCMMTGVPDGSACGPELYTVCSTAARLSCLFPAPNSTLRVCGFLGVGMKCSEAAACSSWLRCNPITRKCQAGQLGEPCPQGATVDGRECETPLVCRAGEERRIIGRPGTCQYPYCTPTSPFVNGCTRSGWTCALEDGSVAEVKVRGKCYPGRVPAAPLRVGMWAKCVPFGCTPGLMCEVSSTGLPALLPGEVGACQDAGGLALGVKCVHAMQGAHSPRGERGAGSMCKAGLLCRINPADPTSPFGLCTKA